MITLNRGSRDLRATSEDEKPTDVDVNTLLLEVDTGDVYYFDGTTWQKVGG